MTIQDIDLRVCEYFFLPINPLCVTTTTTSSTTTTSTSTSTTTTSSTSTTSTTTTITPTTTTTTTTEAPTTTTTTTIVPSIYGELYNWYAASDIRIAEADWHVPLASEWFALGVALGGYPVPPSLYLVGHKLKSIGNITDGTGLWKKSTTPANEGVNTSGMTVNPSGIVTNTGVPGSRSTDANFWCFDEQNSTLGRYFNMNYNSQNLYRNVLYYLKRYGFSIRLVRDTAVGWTPGDVYTDFDGNSYPTALMADGNIWMVENLRTQHYSDGVEIPTDPLDWSTTTGGALHTYV
jgi:uncharacterized protein (TIGR02145 family)